MFLGLVVLLGALGFLGVAFYRALGLDDEDSIAGDTTEPVDLLIDVPDLIGLSYGEADAVIRAAGLVPEPSYQINTSVAENTVFAQSPPSGQRVSDGATVALAVSQGENPRVPPVRGRTSIDAVNILRNSGYEVIQISSTSQAEAGLVVFQEPASTTELARGEAVTITVSTGPGTLFVPDVRDKSLGDAYQELVDLGFRVGDRREPSETVPAGEIIDTDPTHGAPVSTGREVFVIVSEGPPVHRFPDVQGLSFDTGKLAIDRSGLVVGAVTFEPVEPVSTDASRILSQTPQPNLEAASGTPVDLVVGEPSDSDAGTDPVESQPAPVQQPNTELQPEPAPAPAPATAPQSSPAGNDGGTGENEGLEQSGADQVEVPANPA